MSKLTYRTRAQIKIEEGYRVDNGRLCVCEKCKQVHYRPKEDRAPDPRLSDSSVPMPKE